MKKNKKEYYLSAVLLLSFMFLTILVITGNTYTLDINAYDLVINLKSSFSTAILYAVTTLASTKGTIIVAVILLILALIFKKLPEYKYVLINLLIAVGLSQAFKHIIQRARPVWKWIVQDGYSYPSGHTICTLVLYGTLILLLINSKIKYKKLLIALLSLIILLTGISRIYFGAHYLTDVLGSLLLGFAILIISSVFISKEFNNDKDSNKKTIQVK